MTDPIDIVGIVKELQEMQFQQELDYKYDHALKQHFPAIAQALLDAVEALEEIECDLHIGDCGYGCQAKRALSRIRSLPRHD